jgi:hypothetical protein
MGLSAVRSTLASRFGALGTPFRIIISLAVCLVVGIALLWLCNEIIYFYLAKSYVDELADSYNLNRGFTTALLWVSFVAVAAFSGLTFSFTKRRRYAGLAGLLFLVVAHSIAIGLADRNFRGDGRADKCFVLSRDSVKILNHTGIDPETGRECRALTPVMAEKIELYKTGRRPTRITSNDQSFFSQISGEPIAWYAADKGGAIEMFDLMGFHPQSGVELVPVNRQVVDTWISQRATIVRRIPVRIDPDKYAFFDPLTGNAKVWSWRSASGDYEFYDGPGFQPRTGEALQPITRDVIADWQKAVEQAAAKKKADQDASDAKKKADEEQADRTARELAERARMEQQARADAEQKARDVETAAAKQRQQAGSDCDRLAANPTDGRRASEGTPFDQLKPVADQAIEACSRATQLFPDEQRYLYQLGRATQFRDRKRAFEIFTALVAQRYPAAYDNLGGMYQYDRKDMATAIATFTQGAALGDADSIVSLADLVDKGLYGQQNPYQTKWSLLNKAAQLNHAGAQRAVAAEKARVDNAEVEQENQREAQRRAGEIFGAIVGGMVRR